MSKPLVVTEKAPKGVMSDRTGFLNQIEGQFQAQAVRVMKPKAGKELEDKDDRWVRLRINQDGQERGVVVVMQLSNLIGDTKGKDVVKTTANGYTINPFTGEVIDGVIEVLS